MDAQVNRWGALSIESPNCVIPCPVPVTVSNGNIRFGSQLRLAIVSNRRSREATKPLSESNHIRTEEIDRGSTGLPDICLVRIRDFIDKVTWSQATCATHNRLVNAFHSMSESTVSQRSIVRNRQRFLIALHAYETETNFSKAV